jgi:glutamine synthetase
MPTPTYVEYIWIDGTTPTQNVRSKTRVIWEPTPPKLAEDLPEWGFDGSSTGQAVGDCSDCHLTPVHVIPDPIRGEHHLLALCEVMLPDGKTPHPSNKRAALRRELAAGKHDGAWFGFEQEHTLFVGSRPLGFGEDRRFPPAQGPYYCGVGADQVSGRDVIEEHLDMCAKAGIRLSGINAEVMPGQWEFQVGPLEALECSDHTWLARYLLYRIAENFEVTATLDPKPIPGDWNGAGMHANFSTAAMREEGGGPHIEAWCEAASGRVSEHLQAYGDGIELRLTGKHETCFYNDFRYGVSDRTASIRIPMATARDNKGYLEDRRPNANACPYAVATVMLETSRVASGEDLAKGRPRRRMRRIS